MDHTPETRALDALAHPGRLAVFRLLVRRGPGGVRPGEIADALGLKPNTLSVYVTALHDAGLVSSERAGRAVLYRVDLERFGGLIEYLVADCCRGRPELCLPLAAHAAATSGDETAMTTRIFNVLFICTGNSARSLFAEAILAREGHDRFRAYSAGTHAHDGPNPHAMALLRQLNYDTSRLRSKSIDEFRGPDAPRMDFVFTVCDRAANEDCPPWPGQPLTAHWGVADPVKVEGTDAEKALAFSQTFRMMRHRLTGFMALPIGSLDRISLQRRLDDIGLSAPAAEADG